MKVKKHTANKNPSPPPALKNQKAIAVFPDEVFLSVWAVWAVFVLINSSKHMPWRLAGGLFDGELGFRLPDFINVFFSSHVVNGFYAVTIFFAALAVGDIFLKKIFFSDLPSEEKLAFEKVFLTIAMGLGIIATAVFILGSVGLLGSMSGVIILKVIVYLLALKGILTIRNLYIECRGSSSPAKKRSRTRFSFLEKLIFVLIVFASFINLMGALTPETFYDSQYYQLGVPTRWLNEGKISCDNYLPASFMPFNINIIYLLAMFLSGGNPIAAKIVHYICGILIIFALYSVGKKYFSRQTGLVGALIFSSVPIVMMVSWKSAVELGIGVFEFASLICILKAIDIGLEEKPANFFQDKKILWLALAGILCGFSLGSKYTSLVFCYVPSALAILSSINLGKKFSERIAPAVVFSCFTFIAASSWYIRNFLVVGNPIHPFFWERFSRLGLRPGNNLFADPSPPEFSISNYLGFLWHLTMGTLQQESYPGAVFLVFIPLLFGLKKIDAKIKFSIIYILLAVVLWSKFGRFYTRYFIPTMSAAALIYGYYIAHSAFDGAKSGAWRFLLIAALLWSTFININFAAGILQTTQDPLGYVFGKVSQKDYLSTQRPSYPAPYYGAVHWINENLPLDSKVLCLGETRALYLKRKFRTSGAGEWWWYQEKLKSVRSAEEFYTELKSDGITHILFNAPEAKRLSGYEPFYFDENMIKVFDEFWSAHVRVVYKDIADIYLPQYNIRSVQKEQPLWWANYSRDPLNYVYVYEILPRDEAARRPQPENFLLKKDFYPARRWQIIENVILTLSKK